MGPELEQRFLQARNNAAGALQNDPHEDEDDDAAYDSDHWDYFNAGLFYTNLSRLNNRQKLSRLNRKFVQYTGDLARYKKKIKDKTSARQNSVAKGYYFSAVNATSMLKSYHRKTEVITTKLRHVKKLIDELKRIL